jgi:hypothetical protein
MTVQATIVRIKHLRCPPFLLGLAPTGAQAFPPSLPRDPFTDIGRTIPEFRSVGLAERKEFHGFSVDKKNVFEIDGRARFLFARPEACPHIRQ